MISPEPELTEKDLIAIANELIQCDGAGDHARHIRKLIAMGEDPLGEIFCHIRSPELRREAGAIYTPKSIIEFMLDLACSINPHPSRVVDPGMGSGRFLMQAARRFPAAQLIGIEIDPVAALIARANLVTLGLANRCKVIISDYRAHPLDPIEGNTLFIGNPPYVRHHLIPKAWKDWFTQSANSLGVRASQLAGLHVHFFLATAIKAKTSDLGVFITASEWLDVNYGSAIRDLLLGGFGGRNIVVVDPTIKPFPDTATTAAITTFAIGREPKYLRLKRVSKLKELGDPALGKRINRNRLKSENRWTRFTRNGKEKKPRGFVELGELFRVHRGQVTGANELWIAGPHSYGLPESVLFKSVTRAHEIFAANGILADASRLRCVIDIPPDLDVLDRDEKRTVLRFIEKVRAMGGDRGYIVQNRKVWWSVGLREHAPIIATYMARRPPAFALNKAQARHINVAHGLYPLQRLSQKCLEAIVKYLLSANPVGDGRTYAGGLIKFEPREMERIMIPGPELLKV